MATVSGLLNFQSREAGDSLVSTPRTFLRQLTFWDAIEVEATYSPLGLGCSPVSTSMAIAAAPVALAAGEALEFWDKGYCFARQVLGEAVEVGDRSLVLDSPCERVFVGARSPVAQLSLAGASVSSTLIRQVIATDACGRKSIAEASSPLGSGVSTVGDAIVVNLPTLVLDELSETPGHWRIRIETTIPGRGVVATDIGQSENHTDGPPSIMGIVAPFFAVVGSGILLLPRVENSGNLAIAFGLSSVHLLPSILAVAGAQIQIQGAGGVSTLGQIQQSATVSLLSGIAANGALTLAQIQQSATTQAKPVLVGASALGQIQQSATTQAKPVLVGASALGQIQQAGAIQAKPVLVGTSTLGQIQQSATTQAKPVLTGASTLAQIQQSATVSLLASIPANGALTFAQIQQSATTQAKPVLTGASTLGQIQQSATVSLLASIPANGALTFAQIQQSATTQAKPVLTGASTLGQIQQSATTQAKPVLTGASTLGQIQQAGAIQAKPVLTGASTLGQIQQSAIAQVRPTLSGSQPLGSLIQSSAGNLAVIASGSQSLGAISQAATLDVGGILPVIVAPALYA